MIFRKQFITRSIYGLILILFGAIGAYLLTNSHAATPYVSIEPENATITAPAVKISDAAASGGSAVAFKLAANPLPTPTPLPNPAPSPGTAIKYMPLGDSITDGFILPGSYRTVLWQRLVQQDHDNIDFVGSLSNGTAALGDKDHEGHSGWCIDGNCGGTATDPKDIYPMITGWQTTYKPDIISIHLGTNDVNWSGNAATVSTRLDALLNRIYQNNPNCYIVLMQNIYMSTSPAVHDAYVATMPGLVSKYQGQGRKISLVDLTKLLTYPADFRDNLHPTQGGYDKMGAAIYPAVSAAYNTFTK